MLEIPTCNTFRVGNNNIADECKKRNERNKRGIIIISVDTDIPESSQISAETMKSVLLLIICYNVAVGQEENWEQLPAFNEMYLTSLQRKYYRDLNCLQRVDEILKSKWSSDLDKISIQDLGNVEPEHDFQEPSKPKYNTDEQEWLMEGGSTSRQIDTCIRGLVPDIVPLMSQEEINCLNSIFAYHVEEEIVHEEVFKEFVKASARKQLPFRRFVSFTDFVELMFQSRTPDALGSLERTVYEHAESFLTTEQDRVEPYYIMEQECEWKNAKALREASNSNAKFKEFERQVRDSVNQQLANRVVKNWNLNTTLPRHVYRAWVTARQRMIPEINEEVAKLRTQKKDAQWLCERATKLAYKFSDEQGDILLGADDTYVSLRITEVAKKARGIEKALEKFKDFRHPVIKTLADRYQNGTRCFSSFVHLVQNHHRFDIALAFVDGQYNYPQFFCKDKNLNLGLIATRFCNCVGSFCVAHGLAALFAEEYTLAQAPDGTFKVVLSGLKSRKKVQSWNRD
ncbi:uncharacterized protein LOC124300762 [Neodiprion virginianus]|uniref:uncharacterized protein LOC124300762 n=1 Tax=Neodiprion virginianus TaxID=2961670 RepID=UPI001EE74B62|nr:uncharacterized protein LOC124300762 [Neodiprion virginianus]